MRRIVTTLAATAAMSLGLVGSTAQADTTASFNGCVYHADTYVQAVDAWFAAGTPTCGPGFVLSVSVDTTVSGEVVDPSE